jgi:signal transduction histidine kinase
VSASRTSEVGWLGRLRVSVRLRLTLWYVLLLGVALLAFGATVFELELRRVDLALQLQLQADAQALVSTYGLKDGVIHPEALPTEQSITLDKTDYGILVRPDGTIVQRLGPLADLDDGQLWLLGKDLAVSHGRFSDIVRIGKSASGSDASVYRATLVAIPSTGQSAGWLILATPRPASPELSTLLLTMLVVGSIILVLSAAGGYWLAVRAMRPVQVITQTAAEIGEGDLRRRLGWTSTDELGQLCQTFDRMLDRLSAAFDRERQFTSDASHELRTPLSIVDLEVTRALAARRSAEEYRSALATIRAETDVMIRLVSGLLTLARADAKRTRLTWEALDLGDLSLEVVERLVSLADRAGVRLETGDLPEVVIRGDRMLVGQLVTNLVENAIKYTSGIGSHVKVTVGERQEGNRGWAWVRVEDDGPGIDSEDVTRVFERFYRVDRARSERDPAIPPPARRADERAVEPRGSGLGLPIARWIARAHGGDIELTSVVGRGSVFEVRLPLDDANKDNGDLSPRRHFTCSCDRASRLLHSRLDRQSGQGTASRRGELS